MLKKLSNPFARGERREPTRREAADAAVEDHKALAGQVDAVSVDNPEGGKRERKIGEAVVAYHQKMLKRSKWCHQQASRLPLNSNGRLVCEAERDVTFHIANYLRQQFFETGAQEQKP